MNDSADLDEKPKLREYATEAQIEFFDRLQSGDDPVHEEARAELVALASDTLELLGSLRVDKADHDAEVRRILAKLEILAGYEVELFTLDIVTDGYDISDADLMNDLKDEAKARFNDDEKLVLALLAEPQVSLDEVDNDYGSVGHHLYSFSTIDPVIAEKYGFMDEADREAEAEEARVAAEQRAAERAKADEAFQARVAAEGLENVTASIKAKAIELKGEAAITQIWTAIESVESDPTKQIKMLAAAVGL
jgi:hypothetical protein